MDGSRETIGGFDVLLAVITGTMLAGAGAVAGAERAGSAGFVAVIKGAVSVVLVAALVALAAALVALEATLAAGTRHLGAAVGTKHFRAEKNSCMDRLHKETV